jgi:hypothetical protein
MIHAFTYTHSLSLSLSLSLTHTHTQAGRGHLDAAGCKRGEWEVREGVVSGGQGVGGKEDVGGRKVADGKEGKGVGGVGSRLLALDPKIVQVCVLYAGLVCLV